MNKLSEQPTIFTNLQMEILNLFAKNIPENDLLQIKFLIARYFANKAIEKCSKEWEEKGLNEDAILNMHLRTPYKEY